jgi:mannose-6-phosphate isomerase
MNSEAYGRFGPGAATAPGENGSAPAPDQADMAATAATAATARILPLRGRLQHYAWGSTTAIYDLLDEAPTGQPAAELWLGTHPVAPAQVEDGGRSRPLTDVVGPLPFLLKVLAAEKALSLQVHPDPAQARAGFDAEEAAGVPLDAAHRRYRDPSHKPELIVAITPFRALAGVREPARTLAIVRAFGLPELDAAFAPLADLPERGAAEVLRRLLTLPPERATTLADDLVRAAAALPAATPAAALSGAAGPGTAQADLARAVDLVARLAEAHPGDVGIAAALLLNDVTLRPGEGLFQPARLLHAYVSGLGIEIMATSDNVLRGGLTPKHIDVDELLRILDPTPTAAPVLTPRRLAGGPAGQVRTWDVPVDEFRLVEATCERGAVTLESPTVLLTVEGEVTVWAPGVSQVRLGRGEAAVVTAPTTVTVRGTGRVFAARAGV